jgi:flavorubredoxin
MPFAANLLENIQNRKLEVERIVPVHGRVVPFTDLQTAAGSAAR